MKVILKLSAFVLLFGNALVILHILVIAFTLIEVQVAIFGSMFFVPSLLVLLSLIPALITVFRYKGLSMLGIVVLAVINIPLSLLFLYVIHTSYLRLF